MEINEWDLYPNKYSKCETCEYYFKDKRNCWYRSYIPVMVWNGSDHLKYECKYFKSTIPDQCNSHYIHKDYESMPETKFGGKWKFNLKGERIGEL